MAAGRNFRASAGLTTVAARTVLALPHDGGGRAEQIAQQLARAIQLGLISDGARFPNEIRLADQLGVATVTLREALAVLRSQGLVLTRRGRDGGTFVRAPEDDRTRTLINRISTTSIQQLRELGDHRKAVSGMAAALAAHRIAPEEIADLRLQIERLRAAGSGHERRRADTQIGIQIAAGAQSSRLTREESRLQSEVGDLLWLDVSDAEHRACVTARAALVDAIHRRDSDGARAEVERHIDSDTARLARLRLEMYRSAAARRNSAGPRKKRRSAVVLAAVGEALDEVFASLEPLAGRFSELVSGSGDELRSEDLAGLRPVIFELLRRHRGVVGGAGIVTAPDLLADTSHWLEWWWTGLHGKPEALRVDPDPTAPDFFDYVTADWYATPIRTGDRRIAGPYVDYICTTEYAVTLSIPVMAGGRAVGVAAADVPVSSLETLVVPALLEIDQPAALVSVDGRIIASNSANRLPGDRIDPPPGSTVLTWAPWLLVAGP